MRTSTMTAIAVFAALLSPLPSPAGPGLLRNMPGVCAQPGGECDCQTKKVSANCIKAEIGLGETTPWTGSRSCALKVFADDDSPSVFTVESLYAVLGGYTFKRLGQRNMSDGVTPAEVVFSHPRGEPVRFVFGEGESWGRPDPGVHVKMDERLMMVDAEGWAVTSNPVYYDLYVGDGTRRRFLATNATGALGKLMSVTDARGVTVTPADMGVDVVYDSNGVRQFLAPSRLANVTPTADFSGYDVVVYALQEPPARDPATGLYALPASRPVERVSVRGENGGKRAVVTTQSGDAEPQRHVFDYAAGDWSLTRPSGVEEHRERYVADERAAQVVHTTVSAGVVMERAERNYKWESWGFAMTNRVDGFGGVTDTTEWTYHTSGNGRGQVKTERRQSGLLVQYAYDNADRVVSETRSGPGMMTEATTYSYTPVDPGDPALPVDTRPRTVVKTLDGVECERTYYVYSPLTNIVERVGTQGAPYGGTNALRTVTAFYPVTGGSPSSAAADGRIASIRHEDGRLDLYDYALVSNLWTETITHLHEQSPEPVSGKTTRDITLTNARGEVAETRTEAYIDGAWHIIACERRAYNAEGKVVRRENLAGQVTTTEWDCCYKISETQPDGSTTTWDYDDDGRMIASSRLIPLDMTNVTWLTTCYAYDDLGRQIATWQTNYAAQVGLPVERTTYDQLGRVSSRIDALGNTTSATYSPDGRTVSVLNPNTSTRTITRSADGDTLSVTGSAVTPEFHTYGILPDGTRWSRTVQGETASSPRFTKRYENLLGQTVREERSGFKGAVLSTTNTYDSLGRLVRTSPDYEPTVEHSYDITGARSVSVRNADGQWRKTETASTFAAIDGAIWLTQSNIVSCSDTTITSLATSSLRQLTGLTAALPSRSRSTDVRGNVTESERLISSSLVTFRQAVPYATNKPLSISRYGMDVMDVSVSAVTNTYAYDPLGRPIAHTDGRGNTKHTEYNALGQRSASIDALGNRTTYAYDQYGNLAAVTNPLGNAIVYEYDLRGRKTYEGGATYPVRYTYDTDGRRTSLTSFRTTGAAALVATEGDTTTWTFDPATGFCTIKTYADNSANAYTYTPDGKPLRTTYASGRWRENAYNAKRELASVEYSDGEVCAFAYDEFSHEVAASNSVAFVQRLQNDYGQVTNETATVGSESRTVEREFDALGRLTDNDGSTYEYASDGRMASISNALANVEYLYTTDRLDAGYALTLSNGLVFTRSLMRDAYRRSLVTDITNSVNGIDVETFSYAYDALNRPTSRNADTFGYNDRSEVTSATIGGNYETHEYDSIGNSIIASFNGATNTYSANNLNQYTMVGRVVPNAPPCSVVPTYDLDGNLLSDGVMSFTYDAANRLKTVSTNGIQILANFYDAKSRRVKKVTSEATTTFFYDDWNLIEERVAYTNGTTSTIRYFWGKDISGDLQDAGGVGGLLYLTVNGTIYIPCYDNNGNITRYLDASGNTVAQYTYDAFGKIISKSGPLADFFRHRFSTKYYDAETGLYYYGYRFYYPILMRWLNRDPIEEEGGENLYGFVNNYPCLAIDSTGLYLELTISPTVREIRKGRMRRGYLTDDDLTAYDTAYAEFRPRFDAAVSNLKKCCSKKGLSADNVCILIMNPSEKVYVVFEINPHTVPEPEYGNGESPYTVLRARAAADGKEVSGIALRTMYNTRTRQPVPLFLYYDEAGKTHRESLEALLFHELTHYDQYLRGDNERNVDFDASPDNKDFKRYGSWREEGAVLNENKLRRCCPELNDSHMRAYWKYEK